MSTELIDRLVRDRRLARDEFESLLSSATVAERAYARDLAVAATRRQFGNRIYVRGLIEFSNHCRRDCLYCGLRRSNRAVERYRLSPDDILASCAQGHAAGYRTFVLQSGEDARFTDDLTTETVRRIRAAHPDCAITLSIGERSRAAYQRFFDAGADRFLLRHETATSEHFARLHPRSQTLETRMRCLADLKEIGFQSGAGFMVGSPFQTLRNLAADLAFLAEFRPHMVGVGPFLPHRDTPFRGEPGGSVDLTLFLLSLIRLTLPTALIPATTALSTARTGGWKLGIEAGANVLMVNITPTAMRDKYLLYDNKTMGRPDVFEETAAVRERVASIGYEIVVDRGDHQEETA